MEGNNNMTLRAKLLAFNTIAAVGAFVATTGAPWKW
jgi:hypothetical protein